MAASSSSNRYDVFFSYAPEECELASVIVEYLEEVGLSVWHRDEETVDDYAGITSGILDGLGRSKFVLALYSATYPRNRVCQSELAAAHLVGQREGGVENRLLIVNQERDTSHIYPRDLRADHFGKVTARMTQRLRELAGIVKERADALSAQLGRAGKLSRPPWHGSSAGGYDRFIGRFSEMWQLHQALTRKDQERATEPPVAVVYGPRGMGKTAFVEEYALRFGVEYPGGVFWLRAYGTESAETGMGPEEREAERGRQIREIATDLALIAADRNPGGTRRALGDALGRRNQTCLWIVDDFPPNLDLEALKAWIGPHELARTIITTRSNSYANVATPLEIGSLDTDAAHDLLTKGRAPDETKEKQAARQVVRQVGGHPLALAVLASLADPERGNLSFADIRQGLTADSHASQTVIAALGEVLPVGHEQTIANALIRAVSQLDGEAQNFLRLAAALAAAPIEAGFFAKVSSHVAGEPMSEDTAMAAMQLCDTRALTEKPDDDPRAASVHRLICQVSHLVDPRPARLQQLRAAAITVLMDYLPERYDPTRYSSLGFEVVHARELVRRAHTVSDAELTGRLARYDLVRGAHAVAEKLFLRQLDTHEELYGDDHATTAESCSDLAGVYVVMGDLEKAAAYHARALAIRKRSAAADDRTTLRSFGDLAAVRFAQGRLADAQQLQKQALEISYKVEGEHHPQTTTAAWNLFLTLDRMGDEDGAEAVRRQHLFWLVDTKPGDISVEQRKIKELAR